MKNNTLIRIKVPKALYESALRKALLEASDNKATPEKVKASIQKQEKDHNKKTDDMIAKARAAKAKNEKKYPSFADPLEGFPTEYKELLKKLQRSNDSDERTQLINKMNVIRKNIKLKPLTDEEELEEKRFAKSIKEAVQNAQYKSDMKIKKLAADKKAAAEKKKADAETAQEKSDKKAKEAAAEKKALALAKKKVADAKKK
jgi:hypothetical protein